MPPKKNKQAKQNSSNITQQVQAAVRAAMRTVPAANPAKNTFLGDMGQFAGNGISKIFGLGAYKMARNSLYSSQTGAQVPYMHSSSESIVFRHREYIGEVSSTAAFTTTTYPINPGLAVSFPYLSTIATCFQEYKFRGLIFEFKSTGADAIVNGTNSSLGTVGLVAQYRADAPGLVTKQEFMNEMWSTSCKTSENCILPVECAPKENPMAVQYVRSGPVTSGDVKLFDLCSLTVATNGSPGANVVGELWASYEVEFFKPTMSPTGGVLQSDHFRRSNTAGTTPFGSIGVVTLTNTIGCVVSPTTITFPLGAVGRYLVTIAHIGASAAWIPGAYTTTNCSLAICWNAQTSDSVQAPPSGVASTVCSYNFVVVINGAASAQAVVAITGTLFPANSVIDVSVNEVVDSYI